MINHRQAKGEQMKKTHEEEKDMTRFYFAGTFQHQQFCQRWNLRMPHLPHALGGSNCVGLEHICSGLGTEEQGLFVSDDVPSTVYGGGYIRGTYTTDFKRLCEKAQSEYILKGDWGWQFFLASLVYSTPAGFLRVATGKGYQTLPIKYKGKIKILCQYWQYGGGFYGKWMGEYSNLALATEAKAGFCEKYADSYYMVAVDAEKEGIQNAFKKIEEKKKEREKNREYRFIVGWIGAYVLTYAYENGDFICSPATGLNIKIPIRKWVDCPGNLLFLKEGITRIINGALCSFYIRRRGSKIYIGGTPLQMMVK